MSTIKHEDGTIEWINDGLDDNEWGEMPMPDPNYVPPYDSRRYNEYPPLQEQLGLLWHDINDGLLGESAKNSTWYKKIKEVKDKHPKD